MAGDSLTFSVLWPPHWEMLPKRPGGGAQSSYPESQSVLSKGVTERCKGLEGHAVKSGACL